MFIQTCAVQIYSVCVLSLAVLTVIKEPPQDVTVFLGSHDALDFTCVTGIATSVFWVNGTTGENLSLEHPEDVSMSIEQRDDGSVVYILTIAAREGNNGTVLECVAADTEAQRIETRKATLLIQGTKTAVLQCSLDFNVCKMLCSEFRT